MKCYDARVLAVRGMRSGTRGNSDASHAPHGRDAEIVRLRAEINALTAQHQARPAHERQ
ncbi:MAG: hypothetical protein ACRDPT_16195 [Streptomycetales bacterium]